MTGSTSSSYQVLWSRKALDALKAMRDKVKDSDGRLALAQAIRVLDQRLRANPLLVGEVYRSKGGVAEHLAVHELVAIDFAIDAKRKIVVVRDARALSGLGL